MFIFTVSISLGAHHSLLSQGPAMSPFKAAEGDSWVCRFAWSQLCLGTGALSTITKDIKGVDFVPNAQIPSKLSYMLKNSSI